ncbi:hypothetical protein E2C01_091808 [Portunus trituberculatus]|uniref:Uncharacterized protein n=1 Tax=Portunus trituberculatus TaxID=210409 RepID=A0A5B7JPN5_PORTR|nr:hypothetical protein [Portunus trituberculatus]
MSALRHPLSRLAGVRVLALLLLLLLLLYPGHASAQHHHQQQQGDPGGAASGGRRALVTVSLHMQDRRGKYTEQEVKLWGAFSPLAAAAPAEGRVIQVRLREGACGTPWGLPGDGQNAMGAADTPGVPPQGRGVPGVPQADKDRRLHTARHCVSQVRCVPPSTALRVSACRHGVWQ